MVELIIEDGSIVPNANSFVTIDEIITYATNRGVELDAGSPLDESKIAVMAIKAMDYLNSLDWKGARVESDQPLCWPRQRVYVDCERISDNVIPRDIKYAQCQLCIYISLGIDIMPVSGASAFVKREKVGPIETEYSEAIAMSMGALPTMPLVDSLLEDYLSGGGFSLRSVRV